MRPSASGITHSIIHTGTPPEQRPRPSSRLAAHQPDRGVREDARTSPRRPRPRARARSAAPGPSRRTAPRSRASGVAARASRRDRPGRRARARSAAASRRPRERATPNGRPSVSEREERRSERGDRAVPGAARSATGAPASWARPPERRSRAALGSARLRAACAAACGTRRGSACASSKASAGTIGPRIRGYRLSVSLCHSRALRRAPPPRRSGRASSWRPRPRLRLARSPRWSRAPDSRATSSSGGRSVGRHLAPRSPS